MAQCPAAAAVHLLLQQLQTRPSNSTILQPPGPKEPSSVSSHSAQLLREPSQQEAKSWPRVGWPVPSCLPPQVRRRNGSQLHGAWRHRHRFQRLQLPRKQEDRWLGFPWQQQLQVKLALVPKQHALIPERRQPVVHQGAHLPVAPTTLQACPLEEVAKVPQQQQPRRRPFC